MHATDVSHTFSFPTSNEALHNWLHTTLEIDVPRESLIPGHAAPFEYLHHVFFETDALLPSSLRRSATPSLDSVLWANRGGGKTFLGAVATVLDLVFKPGVEVRILGGSLEQSKRMLAHLRRLFERPALAPLLDGRITERRVKLTNGSVAEVLAQSETSVRGTRVQKLRCDEVELFTPELWEAAQLVTRSATIDIPGVGPREIRGSIECLSTMHRPYGLMHRVVAEAHEGRRSLFRWGVVDVLEHCPEERTCETCPLMRECGGEAKKKGVAGHIRIEDAIRMKSRVSLATWESEMLCLRPQRSDSVYPEFDPAAHVVGEGAWRAPTGTLLAGMDFGFRAPTVILWAVLDDGGVLWVLAERVRTETVLDEHARALLDGPRVDGLVGKPAWVGADPAGNQQNDQTGVSSAHALRKAGLAVRTRQGGVQTGIALVRARLAPAAAPDSAATPPPRLYIHARCTRLIKALTEYHYSPDDPESLDPVKDGPDHAVDALRYLIQNLDGAYETRRGTYIR